jgi:hypothetical protein
MSSRPVTTVAVLLVVAVSATTVRAASSPPRFGAAQLVARDVGGYQPIRPDIEYTSAIGASGDSAVAWLSSGDTLFVRRTDSGGHLGPVEPIENPAGGPLLLAVGPDGTTVVGSSRGVRIARRGQAFGAVQRPLPTSTVLDEVAAVRGHVVLMGGAVSTAGGIAAVTVTVANAHGRFGAAQVLGTTGGGLFVGPAGEVRFLFYAQPYSDMQQRVMAPGGSTFGPAQPLTPPDRKPLNDYSVIATPHAIAIACPGDFSIAAVGSDGRVHAPALTGFLGFGTPLPTDDEQPAFAWPVHGTPVCAQVVGDRVDVAQPGTPLFAPISTAGARVEGVTATEGITATATASSAIVAWTQTTMAETAPRVVYSVRAGDAAFARPRVATALKPDEAWSLQAAGHHALLTWTSTTTSHPAPHVDVVSSQVYMQTLDDR